MSQDYTALIAKWNTLTGTTASKMAQINALTVTGSIPTQFYTTCDKIANCINWPELAAMTAANRQDVLALCRIPGNLTTGSGNLSALVTGMIIAYFPAAGPTITALTALAQSTVQPWCNTPVGQGGGGLASPTINANDLIAAGGLV